MRNKNRPQIGRIFASFPSILEGYSLSQTEVYPKEYPYIFSYSENR